MSTEITVIKEQENVDAKSILVVHSLVSGNEQIEKTYSKSSPEDGYNWRKYGQKLVKGNEFVRSYYRCAYPNCLAKRQIERTYDGPITDMIYLGQHEHPKPQVSPRVSVGFVTSDQPKEGDEMASSSRNDDKTVEPLAIVVASCRDDGAEGLLLPSHKIRDEIDDTIEHDAKRQKKDFGNNDETSAGRTNAVVSRQVVQTRSEVDLVNDGYRWRKYGQKMVKGSPNPRSYYRCSNIGCPMKKHVERSLNDSEIVVTTYEGGHNHDAPSGRTVTPNLSTPSSTTKVKDAVLDIGCSC